ncbi:collagen alpha-1(XII) chain-like [Trachinotus anak]|uniref:collagen alpha-1(XII) chain-like n=1 Tax=Trachinotus anak TaxID=443729 RepID=UPI0039F24026
MDHLLMVLMLWSSGLRAEGNHNSTEKALYNINHENFKPHVRMRGDSQKIAFLIARRQSWGDINFPSQKPKDNGIEIYAIGVKDAATCQLTLASHPKKSHMSRTSHFSRTSSTNSPSTSVTSLIA